MIYYYSNLHKWLFLTVRKHTAGLNTVKTATMQTATVDV